MYNADNLHQCQEHEGRKPRRNAWVDWAMIIIGAGASLSGAPQAWKIFEQQDAGSVSLATYLIALASVAAWFAYGMYIGNKPLIYTTGTAIIVNGLVVAQILIY